MRLLDNGNNSGHRGFLDKLCGLEWTGRFHLLTLEMIANEYFVDSGFSICILIGCWSHMENVSDLIGYILKLVCHSCSWYDVTYLFCNFFFWIGETLVWRLRAPIVIDKFEYLDFLRIFMEWFKLLKKGNSLCGHLGYHHTRRIGFPEHITIFFK